MQYPLREKIGNPDLLVGREEEFKRFHKWVDGMPRLISKSWAILGRRKSGKTAFVQRLFNEIWSENGEVIPFYFSIPESPIYLVDLAVAYYETFASHYISFLERDPRFVREPLKLEEIRAYAEANNHRSLMKDTDYIMHYLEQGRDGLVWNRVYRAPHRMADSYDQRILVIIDEFQYLSTHVYARQDLSGEPIEGMPGSFHEMSESKVAPMLATGSYVGWMVEIMGKYLEAGRLSRIHFSPYLTEPEGLLAVYKYAEVFDEPITNETAVQINTLCKADPFFTSCVMQSSYPERDLTTTQGVIEVVNYEVANRNSELSGTWQEYIDKTVDRINEKYGKHILLHLSKYNDRYWTPRELKAELQLEEEETTIHRRLIAMVKGDLIEWGSADIDFRGLQDGTLNLILRHRFEKEILQHAPNLRIGFNEELADLKRENRSLQGKLSHVKGIVTEQQLANAMRSRKRFRLRDFFEGATDDTQLNMTDVRTRVFIQRDDGGTKELDIVAQSSHDRVLLVEVKNRQEKANDKDVQDFQEKATVYRAQYPDKTILTGFLALGGFTTKALEACQEHGVAWSTELQYF